MTTEFKICSKCKIKKNKKKFNKDKSKKDGLYPSCTICKYKTDTKWRNNNKEKKKIIDRNYYDKNKDKIKKRSKKWYLDNIEHVKEVKRKYNCNNFEKMKNVKIKWRNNNKEKMKQYFKDYFLNNINQRIRKNYGTRLRQSIKKEKNTIHYCYCELNYLIKWLEYQFDKNMNWNNYGEYWHIDHVKPVSSFNFENNNEIIECFKWTNLQPLEKIENIKKYNKIYPDMIKNHKIKVKKFILLYGLPTHNGNIIENEE